MLKNTTNLILPGRRLAISFQATRGVPQGDDIYMVLFTINLEATLPDLGFELKKSALKDEIKCILYADDSDFVTMRR